MRRGLLLLTVVLAGCSIGGSDERAAGTVAVGPSPTSAPTSSQPQAAEKLGFPTVATRNTVRVGGGDVVADLAGVASAVFHGTTPEARPHALVVRGQDGGEG